ncbi:geranylgeranyl pyrophosphate synthase [Murinocardiopsis flavida]|uniref:Geranylgeranyl pyrophosphate synthase n=1 Tax=Murinocardiopsis flavida TaxID=645275 RepID=A0A2P8DG41_9ACTN|nr:polyprenyl synthetase family protein [Murinocardiopsis flavida]PSK96181.1 geranylgeranyl pyrophosphate synthase [Murinocardiopsis flavida]
MLSDAFDRLSPVLRQRYRELLEREFTDSPELSDLHRLYIDYALRDAHLPRPVLAYVGYHADSATVDFSDADTIAEGLLIAQLLRDVLAIHDDIVDEDLEKFGAAPLPVAFSGGERLTQHGKNLALYYADYLVGVMLRVAARLPAAARVSALIAEILHTNQRGQLAELLAETRPLTATSVDDLLLIGERKAAYYCYVFPFRLGALLAGHDERHIDPAAAVLTRIGTASQVIDDLTGAFPGLIDHDKDTLGEIANLRRTVPLVLLAQSTRDAQVRHLLESPPPLGGQDAHRLRSALWNSTVPAEAVRLCDGLIADITPRLNGLALGAPATQYLNDLVEHRLIGSVDRLRAGK